MTTLYTPTVGDFPSAAEVATFEPLAAAKTSDENRSSTSTLADDSQLKVGFTTNATYDVFARIIQSSGSTPDFKFTFVETSSGGVTGFFTVLTVPVAGSAIIDTQGNLGTVFTSEGNGATRACIVHGTLVVGANAGQLKLQWAQNTLTASTTSVLNGSLLKLHQVG